MYICNFDFFSYACCYKMKERKKEKIDLNK